MSFRVTILGCGSAVPLPESPHTAQYLKINNTRILIDCGENTQVQLQRFKKKIVKLDFIFISHLHGDHFFGLPGLLSTMSLLGRTEPLALFGPKGLKEFIILSQSMSKSPLLFPVHFTELSCTNKEQIHQTKDFTVYAFPLNHRIDCFGFQFVEKEKPYKIIKEKLPKSLTVQQIQGLKAGIDVIENGKTRYKAEDLTLAPPLPSVYSFCSDTAPFPKLSEYVQKSTYLYHEASFTNEHKEKARNTFHSTAEQAAETAKAAQVENLLLGHFSTRYKKTDVIESEAKAIFDSVTIAYPGLEINF